MDVVKMWAQPVRIACTAPPPRGAGGRQWIVSDLVQVLSMMAIPASVLLTCRRLNRRAARRDDFTR
jgi:hypothetical protein